MIEPNGSCPRTRPNVEINEEFCETCGRAVDEALEITILEQSELLAKAETDVIRLKECLERTQMESEQKMEELEQQLESEFRINWAIQRSHLKGIGRELMKGIGRELKTIKLKRNMRRALNCSTEVKASIVGMSQSRQVQTEVPQMSVSATELVHLKSQIDDLSQSLAMVETPFVQQPQEFYLHSYQTPVPMASQTASTWRTPIPIVSDFFLRQKTRKGLSLSTASSPTPRPFTPLSPNIQPQCPNLQYPARKPLPRLRSSLRDHQRTPSLSLGRSASVQLPTRSPIKSFGTRASPIDRTKFPSHQLGLSRASNLSHSQPLRSQSARSQRPSPAFSMMQQLRTAPFLSRSAASLPKNTPRTPPRRCSSLARMKSLRSQGGESSDHHDTTTLRQTPSSSFRWTQAAVRSEVGEPNKSRNILRRAREALKEDPFGTFGPRCPRTEPLWSRTSDRMTSSDSDMSNDQTSQKSFAQVLKSGQLLARRSTRQ